MIRRKTVPFDAPSDSAACSISRSSSMRTGCTARTTNGIVTKRSATSTANCVNATLTPIGLVGP